MNFYNCNESGDSQTTWQSPGYESTRLPLWRSRWLRSWLLQQAPSGVANNCCRLSRSTAPLEADTPEAKTLEIAQYFVRYPLNRGYNVGNLAFDNRSRHPVHYTGIFILRNHLTALSV